MMSEVSRVHVFPNISENLNRSLFKIKSDMLRMAVYRSMAAQRVAREAQDDKAAGAVEECNNVSLENSLNSERTIAPVISAAPARGADQGSAGNVSQ